MKMFLNSLGDDGIIVYEEITRGEFQTLYDAVPEGGILDLGNKIAVMDRTNFNISKDISILNGGFKRADTPIATTTTELLAGGQSYEVDDASVFAVGQRVQVVYGQAMDQSAGMTGVNVIQDITGNVITSSGPAVRTAPIGSKVIWSYPIFALTTGKNIIFDGCRLDGNRDNNNITYDWKYNSICALREGAILKNCEIFHSPNESFFMAEGGQMLNNYFHDLNGSIVHMSNGNLTPVLESIVTANYGHNICEVNLNVNGHNEGVMTFSARSQVLRFLNNNFYDCPNTYCYGAQGTDDFDISCIGNNWDTLIGKVRYIAPSHPDPIDTSQDIFVNVPQV